MGELRRSALVFAYSNDGTLIGYPNNYLSRSTVQFQQAVESSKDVSSEVPDPSEGAWPRTEVRESVKAESKGRVRMRRHWSSVRHNTSQRPATDVGFKFVGISENSLFYGSRKEGQLGKIPPSQEIRFPLLLAMGSP